MKVKTIGRSQENDIMVNDEKVSRNHLQIVQDDSGNCSVVDLNSTNGTFVNGQQISSEVRLQANDVVKIGNTVLPWQTYFMPPIIDPPPPPMGNAPKPKSKRIIWFIAAAVVILLLASGGVYWWMSHDKESEPVPTEITPQPNLDEIAKEKAIERFNKLKDDLNYFIGLGGNKATKDSFLKEMKEIAEKYPDDNYMQSIINELESLKIEDINDKKE